jgi:hypothetical protein
MLIFIEDPKGLETPYRDRSNSRGPGLTGYNIGLLKHVRIYRTDCFRLSYFVKYIAATNTTSIGNIRRVGTVYIVAR